MANVLEAPPPPQSQQPALPEGASLSNNSVQNNSVQSILDEVKRSGPLRPWEDQILTPIIKRKLATALSNARQVAKQDLQRTLQELSLDTIRIPTGHLLAAVTDIGLTFSKTRKWRSFPGGSTPSLRLFVAGGRYVHVQFLLERHYDDDWESNEYLLSSSSTAVQVKMLQDFDGELLNGILSYEQKADIYN
ncbi:Hypp5373 [Branchiostoma lanceolatum]|uniref:Hypp5373 protein n=1 Tax=Branchiostoma lanceolatum TaxID=7740 RepID=A0A8K0AJH1_BRALA|nr:Hypp5373 [Branchiostoma lanceolatum]